MMYSYGMGLWGFVMMLIPMAVLGLIIYWAVYSGVKKAMNQKPPNQ